jgi:hypothetical protein
VLHTIVYGTLSQIFFNFRNICVSVAVFRHILQNILQYITKDRDTYTYITEIEKNLGECMSLFAALTRRLIRWLLGKKSLFLDLTAAEMHHRHMLFIYPYAYICFSYFRIFSIVYTVLYTGYTQAKFLPTIPLSVMSSPLADNPLSLGHCVTRYENP